MRVPFRKLIVGITTATFVALISVANASANPSIHCPLDKINFSTWTPGSADKWQAPGRNHWGVDINEWNSGNTGGAKKGAPIRASVNGKIKTVSFGGGAGHHVELVASAGKPMFRYLHMNQTPSVKVGQTVKAGDVLGYVGNTEANTVHLHFDYRINATNTKNTTNAPDPLPLLRKCYRGTSTTPPPPSTHDTCAKLTLKSQGSGPFTQDAACVKYLQQRLTAKGFSTTADGKFGNGTKTQVIAFQKSKGLTQDGIVGPKTWAALK